MSDSNTLSRHEHRSPRRVLGCGLALLTLFCAGCAAGPFSDCEQCVTPCEAPVACFGYFPTCWRPWPCPQEPCIYDWKTDIPAEMMHQEAIPETILPETAIPAANFPAAPLPANGFPEMGPIGPAEFDFRDVSEGYHDSIHDYTPPLDALPSHDTVQLRLLPAVSDDPQTLAAQPTGRRRNPTVSRAEYTQDAHTPFPSRALRTVNFVEQ